MLHLSTSTAPAETPPSPVAPPAAGPTPKSAEPAAAPRKRKPVAQPAKAAAPRRRAQATRTAKAVKPAKPAAAAPNPPVADKPPQKPKAVKPAKPAKPAKPEKAVRPPKPPKLRSKPVRDSFTMPEADFSLIATLKSRLLGAGRETKKSELLRAGLHALSALDTPALAAALGQLQPIKIGRPKKGH